MKTFLFMALMAAVSYADHGESIFLTVEKVSLKKYLEDKEIFPHENESYKIENIEFQMDKNTKQAKSLKDAKAVAYYFWGIFNKGLVTKVYPCGEMWKGEIKENKKEDSYTLEGKGKSQVNSCTGEVIQDASWEAGLEIKFDEKKNKGLLVKYSHQFK